ncbi:41568_t:CDS:2 [Gigaspora margarita]|uniref:41568_t:CDS:1 n=1 Tax=Gigaspora margarita TaxID=4874 RepID=A0ABN7WAV3_GIGMA|nr:41568_t:CDS:2 [Gigaspora margarita]
MPSTLPKQRSQVPTPQLTNLSALPSQKVLESTLQLHPETLKQKLLANSNLRRPLQPVSNNYVETQELNEIIEIQESQKEFFQRNLFTNSNITFHIHNHYYKS